MRYRFLRLHTADNGQGAGGAGNGQGGDQGQGQGGQQQQGQGDGPPEWLRGLQGLLNRNGNDAGAVAALLYQENYQYRRQLDELRGSLPPKGAIILQGEEAQAWEAYRGLGSLDELKAKLAERDDLAGKVAKAERERLIGRAAELHGLRAAALARLPDLPEIALIEQDGKPVSAVVKVDGGDVPLPEYIAQHYAEFEPALRAETQQGTRYPPQGGAGRSVAGGIKAVVSEQIAALHQQRAQVPNPLRRS